LDFLSDFLRAHIKKNIFTLIKKKTLQNSISPWDAITGETTWRSLSSFTLKHGLSQDSNQQVQILEDKDIYPPNWKKKKKKKKLN
jgi:hypothetical protein